MRKICLFFLLFGLVFSLSSCSHIEDLNGEDDYSLATFLTDDDILNYRVSNKFGSLEKTYYQNNQYHKVIEIKKFSGVEKLLDTNDKMINFTIKNEVKSGNFLIVIICNEQIIQKIEANQTQEIKIDNPTKERYLLEIVGESAAVSVTITYH